MEDTFINLIIKKYNNTGCTNLLDEVSNKYICNRTIDECCYKIINKKFNNIFYNYSNCYIHNNSYYEFLCNDDEPSHRDDTIFIIVMYSICICFCMIPLILKCYEKRVKKCYDNKLKKYYKFNDTDDGNTITINNPIFNPSYNP